MPSASDEAEPEVTIAAVPTPDCSESVNVIGDGQLQLGLSCGNSVIAVRRAVSHPVTLESAMLALVRGPTVEESRRGFTSWFGAPTAGLLRDVTLNRGSAVIDFDGRLKAVIPNASTSSGSEALLEQIRLTVLPFDDVDQVELRLNGSCAAFGEWLERDCISLPLD
jgi:hypothetical protein